MRCFGRVATGGRATQSVASWNRDRTSRSSDPYALACMQGNLKQKAVLRAIELRDAACASATRVRKSKSALGDSSYTRPSCSFGRAEPCAVLYDSPIDVVVADYIVSSNHRQSLA